MRKIINRLSVVFLMLAGLFASASSFATCGLPTTVAACSMAVGEVVAYSSASNCTTGTYQLRTRGPTAPDASWSNTGNCYTTPTSYSWNKGNNPLSSLSTWCPAPSIINPTTGKCETASVCDTGAGQVVSSGYYDWGTNENVNPTPTTCDGTCELSYSGGGIEKRQMINGVYHYFSSGQMVRTNAECSTATTPSAVTALPSMTCDPLTQNEGYVNGKQVCLAKSETATEGSETTVSVDGTVTTETTTTTKANPDGTTTVTVTVETVDSATGEKTKNTTTTVQAAEPSSFCQQHPTDSSCLTSEDDICTRYPDAFMCADMSETGEPEVGLLEGGQGSDVPSVDAFKPSHGEVSGLFSSLLAKAGIPAGGQCGLVIPLNIFGTQTTIDLSRYCVEFGPLVNYAFWVLTILFVFRETSFASGNR